MFSFPWEYIPTYKRRELFVLTVLFESIYRTLNKLIQARIARDPLLCSIPRASNRPEITPCPLSNNELNL